MPDSKKKQFVKGTGIFAEATPPQAHSPRRSLWRRRAALAFMLCLVASPAAALDEERLQNIEGLKLRYTVYLGGLHFMDSSTEFTRSGPVYNMEMKAGTQGIVRRLLPWDADLTSSGRIKRDQVEPQKSKVVTYWRDKPAGVVFEYKKGKNGTRMESRFEPPQGKNKKPLDTRPGELDPLTGILQMMASFSYGKGCEQVLPIYDGHRRFDVVLEEQGKEKLQGANYSLYNGEAIKCVVDFNMRGGSTTDREGSHFWEAVSGKSNRPVIYIYLAEVRPDLPPLPVRAVTDTVFGGVVVHLSGISGVKLKKSASLN